MPRYGQKGIGSGSGGTGGPPAGFPYPDAERTVLVDADGDRITGRPPQPGDFYARPPLPYKFGGTLPAFDPGKYPPAQREAALIAFEREELKNRKLLEKAVFYLSQTPDGRRLLREAWNKKFSLVFDRRETEAHGAVGLIDYHNKRVPLHPETTAADLMLTVKHELQHMDNFRDGVTWNTLETLESAQKADRALEGAARVSEAIAVHESASGDPYATPYQFRPPGISQAFERSSPAMAAAANLPDARRAAASGNWAAFARTVLPAYYQEKAILASYDRGMLTAYRRDMPRDMRDPDESERLRQSFGGDYWGFIRAKQLIAYNFGHDILRYGDNMTRASWTHNEIARRLTIGGKPFIGPADARFNMDDPACVAFVDDQATKESFEAFRRKHERLAERGHKVAPIVIPEAPEETAPQAASSPEVTKRTWLAWAREKMAITSLRANKPGPPVAAPAPEPVVSPQVPGTADVFRAYIMPEATAPDAWRPLYHDKITAFNTALADTYPPQKTPIEKIHSAILDYARRGVSRSGLAAEVAAGRELVDMGLRAPMAAFPFEYLMDVGRRVQGGSAIKGRHDPNGLFSDAEKRLLQHWQGFAECGLSPVDGLPPAVIREPYAVDRTVLAYADRLARNFAIAPTRRSVALMSVQDMVAWGEGRAAAAANPAPQTGRVSKPQM